METDTPRSAAARIAAPPGRLLRTFAFLCGAIWFVPVSCTTALSIATPVLSKFDERHVDRGDAPHRFFQVVWLPGEDGKPFGHGLHEQAVKREESSAPRRFLMDDERGRIDEEAVTTVEYRRLAQGPSEQLIEVEYFDGDTRSLSRYRATAGGVTPVYSKVFGREHMFEALPYAFGVAIVLYVAGLFMRRRVARLRRAGEPPPAA